MRTRISLALGLLALVFALGGPVAPCFAAEHAVHHIVLFRFKETTPPKERQAIAKAFAELPEKIPGVQGFQWGTNDSPEGLNKGFTHAFVATFKDQAALDAYGPHEEHQRFVAKALPAVEEVFVYDFEVEDPPLAAEPGRTHHLVFFRYRDDASEADLARVAQSFGELEAKIPGLVSFQTGRDVTPERHRQGFQHPFWLTFANSRARDAYLKHPAHQAFVGIVRPVLVEPFVVDFTVRPSTRSLFITDGLEPYRVYQRDENGVARLEFSGVCSDDGEIEARILEGRRTLDGFDWRRVGSAEAGEFAAAIENVPAGGEYTVEIRRRDHLGNVAAHTEVANILVGDLWILAGQSNMEGYGDLEDLEEPHPLVHCFTMGHRWELAVEPLHWLIDSPDPVHSGGPLGSAKNEEGRRKIRAAERQSRTKGAGLGLPFAKELVQRTGVPIGLIAGAHGGTSMLQWDPAARDQGGASLYGSLLAQVRNAGGHVRGVLWYQGESDANPDAVPLYAERLRGLVEAMRADFGAELPFYYVQIGRFVVGRPSESWDAIQELERRAEAEIPGSAMVSVIDLPLDDLIHVSTAGHKRLGVRLAKIADRELFGNDSLARGPRPESVTFSATDRTVRVHFSGVNGGLSPSDNVRGFSISAADGSPVDTVFNARIDPRAPDTVILELQSPPPEGAALWYGRGLDPVCNLVDAEDFAAPAFGPLPLEH